MIDSYTKCVCSAITITTDTNTTYSSRRIKKFLPNLDLRKIKRYANTVACNYCANKYGLELCGCGSGELFGKCDNNMKEGNNHAIHQLLQIRRQRIQSLKQILYSINQRTEKKKSQNNSRCQRRMVRFRRTNHVDHNYSR